MWRLDPRWAFISEILYKTIGVPEEMIAKAVLGFIGTNSAGVIWNLTPRREMTN